MIRRKQTQNNLPACSTDLRRNAHPQFRSSCNQLVPACGKARSKRLRVPNATPSTLSEAQVQKPVPRNNGPIFNWSKNLTRCRPSLATASGIDIPDAYIADSGLVPNGQSTNNCKIFRFSHPGWFSLTMAVDARSLRSS